VSLLILLAGLIILFQGWTFFRAVLFPWAFLILMIPIPSLIISPVTFPLQLLAARLAAGLLRLFDVPVFLEGNMISLAAVQLDVAEACSGIRSLLTLVTLAIIYGYLMETRKWVQVLLVCLAVPIAVVANSFRIFCTGLLVQYWDPDKAMGFFHEFAGWLIFVLALIMLLAAHKVISFIWKSGPAAPPNVAYPQRQLEGEILMKAGPRRFGVVVVLMLATAIGLQAPKKIIVEYDPPSSLPAQIDGWKGTDEVLDQRTRDILGPGEFLVRNYENALQPWINLYIAYFPTQEAGDTIHSPNHCLPGAGWIPILRERLRLTGPDGSSVPINRYVVSKSGERRLVLYWFQAHGRAVASEWEAKYYLISDSIHMNRSDGGMVRLMTPMLDHESPDAAQARMMRLGSQLLPILDRCIPR
jgi:exosortase D (VPLPA-CTERM-specific)